MIRNEIITDLISSCTLPNYDDSILDNILDLELLIERHTQNRYHEKDYRLLFSNKKLFYIQLTDQEADQIVISLTYIIVQDLLVLQKQTIKNY